MKNLKEYAGLIALVLLVAGFSMALNAPEGTTTTKLDVLGGQARFWDGYALPEMVTDYTTSETVTLDATVMYGSVFSMDEMSDDPKTLNLPAGREGMWGVFVDADATAAADLVLNPDDSDSIAWGTDGVSYNATGDGLDTLTLRFNVDEGTWVPVAQGGTWGAGS